METGSNYENAIKLTLVSRKFVRISKNESWDAHLDHMGFPKMYESSLCGDRCGRKRNAMDPSRWGQTDRRTDGRTDGQTEKFNTISRRFTGDNMDFGNKNYSCGARNPLQVIC